MGSGGAGACGEGDGKDGVIFEGVLKSRRCGESTLSLAVEYLRHGDSGESRGTGAKPGDILVGVPAAKIHSTL